MRKKIEKMRHKSEKSAQERGKTWVAMERKAHEQNKAKQGEGRQGKVKARHTNVKQGQARYSKAKKESAKDAKERPSPNLKKRITKTSQSKQKQGTTSNRARV